MLRLPSFSLFSCVQTPLSEFPCENVSTLNSARQCRVLGALRTELCPKRTYPQGARLGRGGLSFNAVGARAPKWDQRPECLPSAACCLGEGGEEDINNPETLGHFFVQGAGQGRSEGLERHRMDALIAWGGAAWLLEEPRMGVSC